LRSHTLAFALSPRERESQQGMERKRAREKRERERGREWKRERKKRERE
jgi:hypothetical protein